MVPFMSVDLDADTLHRIIEMDYEMGENVYGKILDMFRTTVNVLSDSCGAVIVAKLDGEEVLTG